MKIVTDVILALWCQGWYTHPTHRALDYARVKMEDFGLITVSMLTTAPAGAAAQNAPRSFKNV